MRHLSPQRVRSSNPGPVSGLFGGRFRFAVVLLVGIADLLGPYAVMCHLSHIVGFGGYGTCSYHYSHTSRMSKENSRFMKSLCELARIQLTKYPVYCSLFIASYLRSLAFSCVCD